MLGFLGDYWLSKTILLCPRVCSGFCVNKKVPSILTKRDMSRSAELDLTDSWETSYWIGALEELFSDSLCSTYRVTLCILHIDLQCKLTEKMFFFFFFQRYEASSEQHLNIEYFLHWGCATISAQHNYTRGHFFSRPSYTSGLTFKIHKCLHVSRWAPLDLRPVLLHCIQSAKLLKHRPPWFLPISRSYRLTS